MDSKPLVRAGLTLTIFCLDISLMEKAEEVSVRPLHHILIAAEAALMSPEFRPDSL